MSFQFNQVIGERYQLKAELGQGAHGKVCRAHDAVRNGPVALKLYNDDALDVQSAEAAHQFQVADGSAILPLLEVHPEFIEAPTTVMPLAAGTYADPPVFASKAVYVIRRTLTALEFCHGRGVIHGDVKPSNIFRDESDTVMLGDFGVAGYTPEYAASELAAGGPKNVATDLWAVAVSFYELLCRALPFGQRPDLDEAELAELIAACDYTNPDDRLPWLPLRFRTFFRNAFIADPAQRSYTTAADMRGALADLSVCVEWVKMRRQDRVVCFVGQAVARDGRRTDTMYEATIVERKRKGDFVPVVKKAPAGQGLRKLTGLRDDPTSRAKAAQQLSVWMRRITESGDYRG